MAMNDWSLGDGRVVSLITPEELAMLAPHVVLLDINGGEHTVELIRESNDIAMRDGHIAYGLLKERKIESVTRPYGM